MARTGHFCPRLAPNCSGVWPITSDLVKPMRGGKAHKAMSRRFGLTYPSTRAPPTLIIEVNASEPLPQLDRKPTEDNANIFLVNVMDSVAAGNRYREFNLRRHLIYANPSIVISSPPRPPAARAEIARRQERAWPSTVHISLPASPGFSKPWGFCSSPEA